MLSDRSPLRGCLTLIRFSSGRECVECADGGCAAHGSRCRQPPLGRLHSYGACSTNFILAIVAPPPAGEREVTLLDYGAGNVRSVRNAIKQCGYTIKDVSLALPAARRPSRAACQFAFTSCHAGSFAGFGVLPSCRACSR